MTISKGSMTLPSTADADNRPRMEFASPGDATDRADGMHAVVVWPTTRPALADVARDFECFGLRIEEHEPITAPQPAGNGATADRFRFGSPARAWAADATVLLVDAFETATAEGLEIDRFCMLTPVAGLCWRDVVLVRCMVRYLQQAGLGFSDAYVVDTLLRHNTFTKTVVSLFHTRFDPALADRDRAIAELETRLAPLVEDAATLDEDRILRALSSFVGAVLRTNWYQRSADGRPKNYASFKLEPSRLAQPGRIVPHREIFVRGSGVEGVHVRAGAVARGGLRWSDRPESYRTEVLGLMTTQTVKNSPIVPTGAKGSYVLIGDVAPDAGYAEFIRGLMDVTDNIVDGRVVAPPDTVVYDDADPYLVVAADKGTARFSDLANSVAAEYDFWLGDAFASGGSRGYDHKAMGITARGAWLSVRRHFAELGVDTQSDPVTVAGIGDMSGDVFGNGMLLSRTIGLVAAFDHRHIFLDPDPDPDVSFTQRRILFETPGSSWDDYPRDAISEGGGVWPRSAKQVPLSPEARKLLGVEADVLPPGELIRAILRAPVDLLWNGGVGTYVKASTETDTDAADPANDAVRVDAADLRCRVVGEGGNLGFTQRARIEFALGGGRINADFIDNAAGVATSDREVNLKIALDGAVAAGELAEDDRNALLAECTDHVAGAVLGDCASQTLAISLAESQAVSLLGRHERLIANLEAVGGLDRTRAVLPGTRDLLLRTEAGLGLTRPEIATLLAHSKNTVRDDLLGSGVPDEPIFARLLVDYFPPSFHDRFPDRIRGHRLRREIIATQIADQLINHVGPGLIYRLEERLGVSTPQVALAYAVVAELFDVDAMWDRAVAVVDLADRDSWGPLHTVQALIERACSWLLRNRPVPVEPQSEVRRYRDAVRRLLEDYPPATVDGTIAGTSLPLLGEALPFAENALALGVPIDQVAYAYLTLGDDLGVFRIVDRLEHWPRRAYWDTLATAALRDEISARLHALVGSVMAHGPDDVSPDDRLALWRAHHESAVGRLHRIVVAARADGEIDLARACTISAELATTLAAVAQ
ncbi:NAD-glutamate dehydrogenase domain-containing protein [Prescottella agglutinans]|uniref:NAD-glutamate dehydrogenase domain-containing protein n=1 Tax=Prescottella agglutinans TaxID=1644129 RepID=UPI003D995E4A